MSLLFHILRAGHASGTHHKLALDALGRIRGADAERWQRLILVNAARYMEGAKAPDNQFKDFKNHVLHVRENMWGGAREKAQEWFGTLVSALRQSNWDEAAWSAGVLSHYYTDPIQPFHTGQTDAENTIHRALEWSISRSYDDLARLGATAKVPFPVRIPDGRDWLTGLVEAGARLSNASYELLLAHYDFHRGVVDPPAGLDQTARVRIGSLIEYAIASFAVVLERAFAESGVKPPEVSLTAETALATLKLPIKTILKKIDDRELRKQVEAMYDELQATGRVERALPEDERVTRDLHAKEVLGKAGATPSVPVGSPAAHVRSGRERRPIVPQLQPRAEPPANASQAAETGASAVVGAALVAPTPPAPPVSDIPPRSRATNAPEIASTPAIPGPAAVPEAAAAQGSAAKEPVSHDQDAAALKDDGGHAPGITTATQAEIQTVSPPLAAAAASAAAAAVSGLSVAGMLQRLKSDLGASHPPAREDEVAPPVGRAPVPATPLKEAHRRTEQSSDAPEPRIHLEPGSNVVDAPSIGPKTAERLKAAGVATVADLFAADPGALSEAIGMEHIRAKTIAEWQDQARLVCEIPGLRGTHAQLLVGAGYRDLRRLARSDAREVVAAVQRFAQSSEGQRILRSGAAPEAERIMAWVKAAEAVSAARAA